MAPVRLRHRRRRDAGACAALTAASRPIGEPERADPERGQGRRAGRGRVGVEYGHRAIPQSLIFKRDRRRPFQPATRAIRHQFDQFDAVFEDARSRGHRSAPCTPPAAPGRSPCRAPSPAPPARRRVPSVPTMSRLSSGNCSSVCLRRLGSGRGPLPPPSSLKASLNGSRRVCAAYSKVSNCCITGSGSSGGAGRALTSATHFSRLGARPACW